MSLLRLYKNSPDWKLTSDKAFSIDDIDEYLSNFQSVLYDKAQYFKNELRTEVKVEAEQLNIQPLLPNCIKYVVVTDVTTNTKYYYYVERVIWRSKNTIQLNLLMDVLNTFKPSRDYQFSNKTKINRQHKNRFKKVSVVIVSSSVLSGSFIQKNVNATITQFGNTYEGKLTTWVESTEGGVQQFLYFSNLDFIYFINLTSSSAPIRVVGEGFEFTFTRIAVTYHLMRVIDYIDEEFTPVLYKEDVDTYIEDKGELAQDWFLVYRSSNQSTDDEIKAVDCFVVPENRTEVNQNTLSSAVIYPEDLVEGVNYYFPTIKSDSSIQNMSFTYYYANLTDTIELTDSESFTSGKYIQIKRIGNTIAILIDYGGNTTRTYTCEYIVFSDTYRYFTSSLDSYTHYTTGELGTSPYSLTYLKQNIIDWFTLATQNLKVISGLSDIDRTDSKIIKIIKMPYFLDNFTITNDVINVNNKWVIDKMGTDVNTNVWALKLIDLNTKFISEIESSKNPLSVCYVKDTTNYNSELRNDDNESKLFNSSFYQEKFVYDSFGFSYALERVNINKDINYTFENTMIINFVMTSTINSKFLFDFTNYTTNKLGAVDYESVLPIARNNDMVLYNNSYINYIRNGFNYDVKSKTRENTASWLTFGLSTIGAVASFASSGVTGGIGVASGIALGVSATTSLIGAISGTISREQSLEEKQRQLAMQSGNIYGSDDVDLMSYYAKNRLKWVKYQVSPVMKKALADLFYFLGYRDNKLGIPNLKTRKRFNFIACDIIFEDYVNLSDEILERIRELYSGGVTFIHHYNGTWDVEQTHENQETLLEYYLQD